MTLGLEPTDRIAVLGARGWFGSTFCALVPGHVPLFRTASSPDETHVSWSRSAIEEFAPTVVVNSAFLTRERVAVEGLERFTAINTSLIEQFEMTASLPSVRAVITVSSGAAVTEPDSPYGSLKVSEEQVANSLATDSRTSVVLRAYSVSGPFVRRPRDYAFSDFIAQAAAGSVAIQAGHPVFRRYVSVSDALKVATGSVLAGWSGVIETGGQLVEMAELADRIIARVNPAASISRAEADGRPAQTYASDDASWQQACDRLAFVPMDLDQQIDATARVLVGESMEGIVRDG